MTKDTWTAKHAEAVLLVAEDTLTDTEIAEQVGISRRTLADWKKDDFFQETLDAVIAEFRAALLRRGIARLDLRLARWNKTWRDLQSVVEERAVEMKGRCAGGDTGLVVLREKPAGMDGTIEEYVVDTALLAELRALEVQASKELGQWTERRDVTSGGKPVAAGPDLRGLSPERLAELEQILMEAEDAAASLGGDGACAERGGSPPDPAGGSGGAMPA